MDNFITPCQCTPYLLPPIFVSLLQEAANWSIVLLYFRWQNQWKREWSKLNLAPLYQNSVWNLQYSVLRNLQLLRWYKAAFLLDVFRSFSLHSNLTFVLGVSHRVRMPFYTYIIIWLIWITYHFGCFTWILASL